MNVAVQWRTCWHTNHGWKIKCIVLNERSQAQKISQHVDLFIWHSAKGKSIETENWSADCQAPRWGKSLAIKTSKQANHIKNMCGWWSSSSIYRGARQDGSHTHSSRCLGVGLLEISLGNCSTLLFCCCDKTFPPKEIWGGKDWFLLALPGSSPSQRKAKAGAWGMNLETGPEVETVGEHSLLACFPWLVLSQLSYTIQVPLPRGGTTQVG